MSPTCMFPTCMSLVVLVIHSLMGAMSEGIIVATGEQLFFALTNSSITDVQLTQDISLGSSEALWRATGGAVVRTANFTMRGSPRPSNPYYPLLDLQYLQALIRMSPGLSFNMHNLTLKRHSLQGCGPDFVAASPGSYMHSSHVWRKNFTGRPYEVAVNLSSSRPAWAPGVNVFQNLTGGLCVGSSPYKCWRAYVAVDFACVVGQPSSEAIRQYIVDGPVSMDAVLDDHCDMTQPTPPTACISNLTSSLESADQLANPQPVTVWATTASQFVSAIVNSTVDLVLITQDITDWTDAQTMLDGMQLPVMRGRNITIRGAALPGVYPALELKATSVILSMSEGSSVTLEHLLIKRLQLLPDPVTIEFTALQWTNKSGGCLVITDCLWHFYTCPSANLLQRQMKDVTSTFIGQLSWSMMESKCIQQPSSPTPSTSRNASLAAFPPSSYTSCFSPAVDMQTISLFPGLAGNGLRYVDWMLFHNSWIVCGEVMDAACQQQWVDGDPTCVLNRVALLSGLAPNSSAPDSPPTGNGDTSASKGAPVIAIAAGVAGGAAAVALAIAGVVILRAKKRRQQHARQSSLAGPDVHSLHSSIVIRDKKPMPVLSKKLCESGPSTNRTSSPFPVSSEVASSEQLVYAEVQAIFLNLARQTMAQPTPLSWGQKVTRDAPLVEGLALDIDIKRDVVVQQVLGAGTHGVVRQGRYKGQPVALKMFPARGTTDQSFVQELHILCRLQNPHIVNLLAAGCDNSHTYLVLELCNTSLDKVLYARSACVREPKNPPGLPITLPRVGRLLPLRLILRLGIQIAEGLAYLHPTIIHRDLKPSNVLLKTRSNDKGPSRSGSSSGGADSSAKPPAGEHLNPEGMATVSSVDIEGAAMTVKLADFGLSRMLASVMLMSGKVPAGTLPYMAPECFSKDCKELTCKSDIYSLGVVLWEMIHGQQPWWGLDTGMILALVVLQQQHLTFTAPASRCPPKLQALIERCWESEPSRRASANDIIRELALIASQLVDESLKTGTHSQSEELGLP